MADHFRAVDNTAGEIDLLSQRLAAIRTLAYIAARPDLGCATRSTGRPGPARWRTGSATPCTSG